MSVYVRDLCLRRVPHPACRGSVWRDGLSHQAEWGGVAPYCTVTEAGSQPALAISVTALELLQLIVGAALPQVPLQSNATQKGHSRYLGGATVSGSEAQGFSALVAPQKRRQS